MLKITKVKHNSIAKELGLEKGDKIISLDGLPCEDELDIIYFTEQEKFSMTVENKRTDEEHTLVVEKQAGESLGICFAKDDKIKTINISTKLLIEVPTLKLPNEIFLLLNG